MIGIPHAEHSWDLSTTSLAEEMNTRSAIRIQLSDLEFERIRDAFEQKFQGCWYLQKHYS
jgi:hypothetical protein